MGCSVGSRVFSAVPKTVRLKGSPVNIAPRVAKAKEKENLPVEMADRIITSNWSRYAINPRHVVVAYGI
jgi:hypothetical protein